MRYNDPPLQPVGPTQLVLSHYEIVDTSRGGFGIGLSMTKEGSDGMEY